VNNSSGKRICDDFDSGFIAMTTGAAFDTSDDSSILVSLRNSLKAVLESR